MYLWIRSMKSWTHLARLSALQFDVPIESAGSDTGSITVAGETKDFTGEWAILDGHLLFIKSCSPKSGRTTFSVLTPERAFTRQLWYTGDGSEEYGTFIYSVLNSEYKSQSDAMYAMPYLSLSNTDTTAFTFPVEAQETYSLTDIMIAAINAGVKFEWTPDHEKLSLAISTMSIASHNVIFSSSHHQIKSQSYNGSLVVKATVRQVQKEDDVITILSTGTFYWHPNGTVSSTPPSPRIAGDWALVDVDAETPLLDGATEAMADNTIGYKIEFWSDREYAIGDELQFRIRDILTSGKVTMIRIKSGDNRYLYRAGSADVTLTEKINSMRKN